MLQSKGRKVNSNFFISNRMCCSFEISQDDYSFMGKSGRKFLVGYLSCSNLPFKEEIKFTCFFMVRRPHEPIPNVINKILILSYKKIRTDWHLNKWWNSERNYWNTNVLWEHQKYSSMISKNLYEDVSIILLHGMLSRLIKSFILVQWSISQD